MRFIHKNQYGNDSAVKSDNTKINSKKLNQPIENYDPSWLIDENKDLVKLSKKREGSIVVKKGDTLSKIAKENNVPLSELIRINSIKNPNLISVGKELILHQEEKENINKYRIKRGDTLYDISKKTGVGINDLKRANNIKGSTIYAGEDLIIPKSVQDQVLSKKTRETFRTNNSVDNLKVINNFYSNRPDEEYLVIDKKSGVMSKYRGNTKIDEISVGTGKNKGDLVTGLGGIRNYYTGAGVYEIANPEEYDYIKSDKTNNRLYGDNIIGFKNEHGIVQGSFLHQVPRGNTARENALKSNGNKRFSQGCINCTKKDFENKVKNVKPGTKLYILPEEDDNFFEIKNDRINFTTNKDKDIRGYNYTYDDKGNYLSNRVRESTYKPFKVKENSTTTHFLDNRNTKKQVEILAKYKKQLMKDLNLDSDTYDILAKQVLGHIKAETATGWGVHDLFERVANKGVDVANSLGIEPFGRRSDNISRGDLQIRYNQIPEDVRKRYGVNEPSDLDDIEKAIPIAMYLKKDGLQQVIAKRKNLYYLNRENLADFVPYQYNQAYLLKELNTNPQNNKYVMRVLNEAKKYQFGGEGDNLTLIEDGEVIKTLDGEIIPYDGIPKHDSGEQILPDGTIKKVKKGDGGAIVNAAAVLSDTTNPNKNRGKNSPKQAPFHFKFKKGEEFLGLKFKKGKNGSPSQMFKYLRDLRDKELKKYDKIEYNEYDDVSLQTQELNEIVKNQLPTDEEIFDGLLEIQEINKDISGEDFDEIIRAQNGMDEERRLAIAQTHPDIFRRYGNIIRGYTKDVIKDPKNIITKIPKVAKSIPGPIKLGLTGMEVYDAIEDGIEDSIEKTGYYPPTMGSVGTPGQPRIKGYQYGGIPRNINGLYEEEGPVIVPSNQITMEGINTPVDSYDPTTGEYLTTMYPGENYYFPDVEEILEVPVDGIPKAQDGRNFRESYYHPSLSRQQIDRLYSESVNINKRLQTEELSKDEREELTRRKFQLTTFLQKGVPQLGNQSLENFYIDAGLQSSPSGLNSQRFINTPQNVDSISRLPQDAPEVDNLKKLRQAEIDYNNRNKKTPPASPSEKVSNTSENSGWATESSVPVPEYNYVNPDELELKAIRDAQQKELDDAIGRELTPEYMKSITDSRNPVNSLRNLLGKIRTNRGLNQIGEAINQLSSGVMPEYISDTTNARTLTPIEIDPTSYLDEVDSAVTKGLQNVNTNTAQGQAIATNVMMNALRNKRSILNQVNSQNQNIRRQVQDQNNQILSAAEIRDDANRKDYFTRTQQADAAYNMNRMNLATQLDKIHNERTNINNVFTLENMRNPNYQIDEFGNVYRVKTKDWNVNPTSAKFGKRKYIKRR